MRKNKNVILEELYNKNGMTLLKRTIAELTSKQDYNTHNNLFRNNPNANQIYTRSHNKDILQNNKRFTKRSGKICNVYRTISRKQKTPQSESQPLNS